VFTPWTGLTIEQFIVMTRHRGRNGKRHAGKTDRYSAADGDMPPRSQPTACSTKKGAIGWRNGDERWFGRGRRELRGIAARGSDMGGAGRGPREELDGTGRER